MRRARAHPKLANDSLIAEVRFQQGEEAFASYDSVRLTQPLQKSKAAFVTPAPAKEEEKKQEAVELKADRAAAPSAPSAQSAPLARRWSGATGRPIYREDLGGTTRCSSNRLRLSRPRQGSGPTS
jgi:hypothetical protein